MEIINFFVSQFPRFSQQVTLDNKPYRLVFRWNDRGKFWAMDINDINDNSLVSNIKLVLNYELTKRFSDRGLPQGLMFCIDTSEKKESIGRYDLDSTVNLVYIPGAEVESL